MTHELKALQQAKGHRQSTARIGPGEYPEGHRTHVLIPRGLNAPAVWECEDCYCDAVTICGECRLGVPKVVTDNGG